MLTDLETAAPPPHYWSWKKVILWPLGFLLVVLFALWAFDEKLQPYDDLLPLPPVDTDPGKNGYFFLKQRWENLPELEPADRNRLTSMLSGRDPWDPALVAKIRKGRENLVADLNEALTRSSFESPTIQSYNDPQALNYYWITRSALILSMEIQAAALEGDMEKALSLRHDLHRLSSNLVKDSGSLMGLIVGRSLHSTVADRTNFLLGLRKLSGIHLERLAKEWQEELPAAQVWPRVIRSEATFSRTFLEAMADNRLEGDYAGAMPVYFLLVLKKNRTLNGVHSGWRNFSECGFLVFQDLSDAQAAGWNRGKVEVAKWKKYLDANYTGTKVIAEVNNWAILPGLREDLLFRPRAMRVKIAILRWQEKHPGQWPTSLQELVPHFLPEVPVDPFNGKPIAWDFANKIIFCAGADWKLDAPKFKNHLAWFSEDADAPGLRMERPPAPSGKP
jgi:hypothetical protein